MTERTMPKAWYDACRRALRQRVWRGCEPGDRTGARCRWEWAGPMLAGGTRQPPIPMMMGRKLDRQRGAYRWKYGARLLKSDRIVAVCGNPRCVDPVHLHVVPALKPAKAPAKPALTCTDPTAGGLASSTAD